MSDVKFPPMPAIISSEIEPPKPGWVLGYRADVARLSKQNDRYEKALREIANLKNVADTPEDFCNDAERIAVEALMPSPQSTDGAPK
jgi:hypothetical protein